MAAVQLNFSLRTSTSCKTVHLLGSWDNYNGQLPLSKDPNKAGGWKGTFRFQNDTLRQGQRYWYYYIIDGYHVSHDPARDCVVEPTTGRKLNTLDITNSKSSTTTSTAKSGRSKHNRRVSSISVPKGRSLSPSQIQSPKPVKPHATRQIRTENFSHPSVEQLSAQFASASVSDSDDSSSAEDEDSEDEYSEDASSVTSSGVPSLSSRSSNNSSPSSVSSAASSCCTCERYGITRGGNRVKLDCGGSLCGHSEGSECSSESDEDLKHRVRTTRRQGLVVRK